MCLPIFDLLTTDEKKFKVECSFYPEINAYVKSLDGVWHFVSCGYDPDCAAYEVEYVSGGKTKSTLIVTAIGGKLPINITHVIYG